MELETGEFGRSGWIWIYGADWVDVCSKQQKREQSNHAWKDGALGSELSLSFVEFLQHARNFKFTVSF